MSTGGINWKNMPTTTPSLQYPALLRQVARGYEAIREEKAANMALKTDIYAALDEMRFGVAQLTETDIPDSQRTVTRA